jgi:hypothetical protein
MTDPTSPGVKALRYAEDRLKVHAVYQHANDCLAKLDETQLQLNSLRAEKRMEEQSLRDLEMELIERERAADPSESVAAFERRFKVVLHNDGNVRVSRLRLSDLAGEIDELERASDILSKDIQITVARMSELGGYLNYLAVIKQAESNLSTPTTPSQTGNPW